MRFVEGSLISYKSDWIVVATLDKPNKQGEVALFGTQSKELKDIYPELTTAIGVLYKRSGPGVYRVGYYDGKNIYCIPVASHWKSKPDIESTKKYLGEMQEIIDDAIPTPIVIVPEEPLGDVDNVERN